MHQIKRAHLPKELSFNVVQDQLNPLQIKLLAAAFDWKKMEINHEHVLLDLKVGAK